MALPKSNVKWTKNGITFEESIDRAQYTLTELIRAANRDVGKHVVREVRNNIRKEPGLKRSRRAYGAAGYWARKRDTDLQVGLWHNTWYAVEQELGTDGQPKRAILRNAVYDNIPTIRQIQAQYLSAIEDELKADALIDEEDYTDGGEEDV